MRKILFVIDNAYSYAGTENICNFMSEVMGKENIIDIVSLDGAGETFYPYSDVRKIYSLSGGRGKYFELLKFLIKGEYGYIFVISMGKLSFLFRWIHWFLKKGDRKIYACEHVSIESFSSWVKILKINALKWYDSTIVLTEHDYTILSSKGLKCQHIVNPIKYHNFHHSDRTNIALAVGRLEYQKGFSDLIDIWAKFVKEQKHWHLYIAGDGSLKQEIENKINSYDIHDNVTLLGKITNMESYYQNSDFLLMTSYYEGLPLVLLEAKSWSLPVIAFDCPTGPKEIIQDQVDGFLIKNRNQKEFIKKIKVLAHDDELLKNMSYATKLTHLNFDEKNVAAKWINLLNV